MSTKSLELIKKISGVAFAIAFLMALVLFANVGRQYISIYTAKMIFIAAGAIGLFLNLLTFKTGKNSPIFNFSYWIGSIVLFIGLIFLQFRFPYGYYIIIAGLVILGLSFFLPSSPSKKQEDSDILDSFN